MIEFDFSRSKLREQSIIEYSDIIIKYDKQLEKDANNNSKMVGWMFLPERYDKNELERILKAKEKIQKPVMGNISTYALEHSRPEVIKQMAVNRVKKNIDIIAPACGLGMNSKLENIKNILIGVENAESSN